MDPERWQRVEAVLDRVLSATDPSSWPTLLDDACGDDHVLRAEVEALLALLPRAPDFLASPPSATASALIADVAESRDRPDGPSRVRIDGETSGTSPP